MPVINSQISDSMGNNAADLDIAALVIPHPLPNVIHPVHFAHPNYWQD
jgi:hypothetical protein